MPQPGKGTRRKVKKHVLDAKKIRFAEIPKMKKKEVRIKPSSIVANTASSVSLNKVKFECTTLFNAIKVWKFPKEISQSTLDGRSTGSNACAVIAALFGHNFKHSGNLHINRQSNELCNEFIGIVKTSIREGNRLFTAHREPTDFLSFEEVGEMLGYLGVVPQYDHDIETCVANNRQNMPYLKNLQQNEMLLIIKNGKVVSIVNCNSNNGLILFDSHIHYPLGCHVFYCDKTEEALSHLLEAYDLLCDNNDRKYGKLIMFSLQG